MVILGLGSNLTNRLSHLRQALNLLSLLPGLTLKQVSPLYVSDALLPENAPPSWDQPYFNLALRCETTLSPYALLEQTKKIEQIIGRKPTENWGPRVVDIDLLAWDDLIQYDEKLHIPHEDLLKRPFALWPLADVAPFWLYPIQGEQYGKTAAECCIAWGSRFSGEAPLRTRQIAHRIDTPELIGILNCTPDSFSDGGSYKTPEDVLQKAFYLVENGADILDIGAEATGPRVLPLSSQEEWTRLEPVLHLLLSEKNKMLVTPKISIDTRHSDVAEKALALGVDWINDVSGLQDQSMIDVVKQATCDCVFMHHLGIPVNKKNTVPLNKDVVDVVLGWGEERIRALQSQGIARERLIFDPGIGFGKTAEQSLKLIQEANRFHALGVRVLIGHSRKSYLSFVTDKRGIEKDFETAVTSLYLAKQKVNYLRVHDTESHGRAFKIAGLF